MPNILHVVAGATFFLTTVALAVALATNNWYSVKSDSFESNFGLFKTCGGDSCESYDWEATAAGSCNREADTIKMRFLGMKIAVIVGLLFAFVGSLASFACMALNIGAVRVVAMVMGILGTFGAGAGIALFAYVIDNWLYCDKTLCEFLGDDSCSANYGWSFYIASVGVLSALVGIICAALAMRSDPQEEEQEQDMQQQQSPAQDRSSAYRQDEDPNQHQQNDANASGFQERGANDSGIEENAQADDGGIPPPPEGDWVYDDASGLYWSDSNYLYLDTTTNQYFDPNSSMWYDPDSDTWYEKKEEE